MHAAHQDTIGQYANIWSQVEWAENIGVLETPLITVFTVECGRRRHGPITFILTVSAEYAVGSTDAPHFRCHRFELSNFSTPHEDLSLRFREIKSIGGGDFVRTDLVGPLHGTKGKSCWCQVVNNHTGSQFVLRTSGVMTHDPLAGVPHRRMSS